MHGGARKTGREMKKTKAVLVLTLLFTFIANTCCMAAMPTTPATTPAAATQTTPAVPVATAPGETPAAPIVGYIFVGDSRLKGVDMYGGLSKNNPDIWSLSAVSRNYSYLNSKADKDITAIMTSNPQVTKWYEVYCLGVNDMGNLQKYIAWYKNRALAHNVILTAVPPTKKCKRIPNSSIEAFNASLIGTGLPYLDLYTYLTGTGVQTGKDGIHYTNATCQTAAGYLAAAVRLLGK